jgi:hypothetical protein
VGSHTLTSPRESKNCTSFGPNSGPIWPFCNHALLVRSSNETGKQSNHCKEAAETLHAGNIIPQSFGNKRCHAIKKVRLRATYNHPETSVQTDSVNEQYEKKAWRNLKKAHVRSVELKRRWGRHAAGANMIILHH